MPAVLTQEDGVATLHFFSLIAAAPAPRRAARVGWDRRGDRPRRTRYNPAMTLSSPILDHLPALDTPADTPADTWDHLTDDDARRVAAAMAASHAETTRKAYAQAWRQWVRWSAGRGLMPFPAEAAAVCAYLTERADQGVSLATIDAACAAIGHQHRSHGLPDPIDQDAVRQVRRGLRRIIGTAPRRPARPLSVADLRQIVTTIDRTTPRGIRDTALILVGFAGALRRSELAALTVDDIEAKPAGLLLHLRRSKTDPERRGQVVGIAHGQHALTDPIAALDAWLAVRGTAAGPVFTSMRPGLTSLEPISGNAVSNIVQGPCPGRRPVARTDHRTLTARRPRHQRRTRRHRRRPDRRADPPQPHRRPHRSLHPPRPSPATTSSRDLGL